MRIEKRDNSQEHQILIGMVVNKTVLSSIASHWEGELFKSSWSNLIGSWCVNFFNRYHKAPGAKVHGLFTEWAAKTRDKESADLIEKFLESLSDQYEQHARECNPDYVLDVAAKHFHQIRLKKLKESLEEDLEAGDVDKADERLAKHHKIEIGMGAGVDVFKDMSAIKNSFAAKGESLIQYPGALKYFFGSALERDGFIAIMAPEKRGKTFWLLDLAYRAVTQQRRVAFFEVGDMSQNQILQRLAVRVSKHPNLPTSQDHPVRWPTSLMRDPDSQLASAEFENLEFDRGLTYKMARRAFLDLKSTKLGSADLLKLSVHANSTLSVNGMKSILERWENAGWTPDVIVVDYADILAPPAGVVESRDQINATWKGLRALSQTLHCLVITATQSNAGSYKAETIDRSNFSEDKRKLAHVTGMFGLNQTPGEKRDGIMRLNWIVRRESEFDTEKCCHVAGCLALGNPAVRSTF